MRLPALLAAVLLVPLLPAASHAARPSKKAAVAAVKAWMGAADSEQTAAPLTAEPFLFDDDGACSKEKDTKAKLKCVYEHNAMQYGEDAGMDQLEVRPDAGFASWQRFSDHDAIERNRAELKAREADHQFVHFMHGGNGGDWEFAVSVRDEKGKARVDGVLVNFLPAESFRASAKGAAKFAREWLRAVAAGKPKPDSTFMFFVAKGFAGGGKGCKDLFAAEDETPLPVIQACVGAVLKDAVKSKTLAFEDVPDPVKLTKGPDAGVFASMYEEINKREAEHRFLLANVTVGGKPARLLVTVVGQDDSPNVSSVMLDVK